MLYDKTADVRGEDDHVISTTFDALIRLDAEAPSEILMPLSDRFRNEVIILLAKSPEKNRPDLLSLLQRQLTDEQWLAICNLLASVRARGFAASLLRELKIRVDIYVTQDPHAWFGHGGSGHGVGCGVLQVSEGFPPLVFYDLHEWAKRGFILVAPGRHSIYYSRREFEPEANGKFTGSSHSINERNQYRTEYLAELLNTSVEVLKFNPSPSFTVVWKSNAAFKGEVTRRREEIKQKWAALIGRLVQAKLLSEKDAAGVKPNITIEIHDERKNKTVKLPDVSEMRQAGIITRSFPRAPATFSRSPHSPPDRPHHRAASACG
ncbi:MAG TPA: hypothetical protein VFD58_15890 [Blastocatellia bacterium]|nr:hypothetical protein [Blastocatellia bacterium]